MSQTSSAKSLASLGMTTVSRSTLCYHWIERKLAVPKLFLFAQFRQDTKILERRRVAGHGFAAGNLLQ